MAMTLYVVNQRNILTQEFSDFLVQSGVYDALHVLPNVSGTNVLVVLFCVLIIFGAISESIKAIKKTVHPKGK